MEDKFLGVMQDELLSSELEAHGMEVDSRLFFVVIKSCRCMNPRCPNLQCQRRSYFCDGVILALSLLRTEVDEKEQGRFDGAFAVMMGRFVLESIVH
jgi:hypothetical protein